MDSAVYEDRPRYDIWLKAILLLPVFFIIMGAFQLISGEPQASVGLFVTAALMAAIYWAIFPRKYSILEGKVKIVLGGPFSFQIPFDTIEEAKKPEGVSLGINFATTFSSKHAVQVVRKGKLNVNITPGNAELFIKNLDKAVTDWRHSTGTL